MPPTPFSPEFSDALRRRGMYDAILEASWIGGKYTFAPKTAAIFGDLPLREEVIQELFKQGFDPKVIAENSCLDACMVEVSPDGKSWNSLTAYEAGLIYPMEASSFRFTAAWVESMIGTGALKLVMDFCAAPGGKALLISRGVKMSGGVMIVNEPVASRRSILLQNLRRCGASFETLVSGYYHEQVPQSWAESFSVINADVPCSGEGLLRKKDFWGLPFWSQSKVEHSAKIQRGMVTRLVPLLKADGHFIYSTCTFSSEENEENIRWIKSTFSFQEVAAMRVIPRRNEAGEGFFGSRLQFLRSVNRHVPNVVDPPSHRETSYSRGCIYGAFSECTRRLWNIWTPGQKVPLDVLHAQSFREWTGQKIELEPTLKAYKEWRSSRHSRTRTDRVLLWKDRVLLLEQKWRGLKTLFQVWPK